MKFVCTVVLFGLAVAYPYAAGACPRSGDVDGNGVVDGGDLDAQATVLDGAPGHPSWSDAADIDCDLDVDMDDRLWLVTNILASRYGDSDLNGCFDTRDFVVMFQNGEYEDNVPNNSVWADGDFNGDREFTTQDLILAFQYGGYETCTGGPHVLFATSSQYAGDFGGLAAADAICQQHGDAGILPGHTWKAVLSTANVNAKDRLNISDRVINTAGQVIATGHADLWDGAITNSVGYNEHGTPMHPTVAHVWSGTKPDGTTKTNRHCNNWTSTHGAAELGNYVFTNNKWIGVCSYFCSQTQHLFCINQY